MRIFDITWLPSSVAAFMRRKANYSLPYNGRPETLPANCKAFDVHTGTVILFTRDEGMHDCGWWKNPDYNRCYHLSLSFRHALSSDLLPFDKKVAGMWVDTFFGEHRRLLWVEPPSSEYGKRAEVWHYRLFMSPNWKEPILPRKEVYSKDWTPKNWKSFSDKEHDLNFGDPLP